MKREVVVSGLGLSADGVDLQYMVLPDDVRAEGKVIHSRQTMVAYGSPKLGVLATDLRTAVEAFAQEVELALAGPDQLPVYEPPATEGSVPERGDDPDEDVGMGDGR